MDSLELAYSYYYNSLLIEQELNNKEGIYYAYYGIAGVDTKRGNYDKAMESIMHAIQIAKEIGDIAGVSVCYSELGKIHKSKNELQKSIQYYDTSLIYATRINFKNSIIQSYKDLSQTWYDLGDKDKAYAYLKKFVVLNDSMNNVEISNKVAEIETRFQIDKKEKEIQFLKKTTALEKQSADTEKRNKYFLLITFILSLILAISNLRRIIEDTRQIIIYVSVVLIILVIMSFIILLTGLSGYGLSLYSFFLVLVDVLTIAILPIFIAVLVLERVLLNRHLKTAQEVSEQINITPIPVNDTKINLRFENESDLALSLKDLICIEANDNYSAVFYYKEGKVKKELYRATLKKLEEQLAAHVDILRCHKSYIINIAHIKRVSGNAQGFRLHFLDLTFDIPVSRKIPREIIDNIKSRL
jgi:DNA-binding LytR/AlgR family response regulator